MRLGSSQLRSLCRGQAVIALSSGEAEYYGLVTAASEALGEQSIAADWGVRVPIVISMDATAGAAIGSRLGLGKVKHIHTLFLWVQQKIRDKAFSLAKVDTTKNLADVITKPVPASLMERAMAEMSFEYRSGRSALAYGTG